MHGIGLEELKKGIPLYKKTECDQELLKNISLVKGKIMIDFPFWGYFAGSLKNYPTDEIDTYACDYSFFYFNPDYLDGKGVKELIEYIMHGATHVMMDHLQRREHRLEEAWVLATEISTLFTLQDFYDTVMRSDVHTVKNMENYVNMSKKYPEMNQYEGDSTEIIYEKIKDDMNEIEMSASSSRTGTGISRAGRKMSQLENKMRQKGCDYERIQKDYNEKMPEGIKKLDEERNKNNVQLANDNYSKSQGYVPLEIREYIEGLDKPAEIDWTMLLDRYIQSILASDLDWRKPSKSMMANDIIMPGIRKDSIIVVIAFDTSGSISDREYQEFMVESHAILNGLMNPEFYLIDCDADVQNVRHLAVGEAPHFDITQKERHGRGGTSFAPVFEYVQEATDSGEMPNIDVLIYFTDLMGSFPKEEPDYPTIWVVHNPMREYTQENVPFGWYIKYQPRDE